MKDEHGRVKKGKCIGHVDFVTAESVSSFVLQA